VELTTLGYLLIYALAAALYLGFHVGFGPAAGRAGRVALAIGFGVQLVDIGVRCFGAQHPLVSISEAMAFIAWLLVGGFLLASLRYRLHAAGAFAVPVVLVLLVLARVVPSDEGAPEAALISPLGTVHIFLATVGVATFALAAVLAVVYLLQERRLKRKRFDKLRPENAPLDTLDRLAARCVSFGFPVFTLTIVTGAVWVARLGLVRTGQAVRPEYLLTVVAWAVLGVLLLARVSVGWSGRRAAWLTVGGFSVAVLVLAGYFIRHAV
jgi:ABC-type uncharacterized transport system permease subunit